jgi:PRC-barrel domain
MRGKKLIIAGILTAAAALARFLAPSLALSLALAVTAGAANVQTPGQTQTEPPAQQPATAPDVPPSVTILNNHDVEGVLGREVLSAADENMGRIVDVIVDRGGKVHAAIIDFGGFLGVGSRKIAVDWSALHFPPSAQPGARVTLELTRDQVKAAPEYQEGKPIVVLGALGKLEPLPFE